MQRRWMVLAVGALLVAGAACSDDDDEGGGVFGGGGGGEVPGQSSDQGGCFGGDGGGDGGGDVWGDQGGGGFTDASQGTFESNCANFPGATPSLCECAWGQITSTVSESEYAAFEQEFLSDPSTPLPGWLTDAVAGCSDDG